MGGKSSGAAYVPKEKKDNLKSTQNVRILDLIGEGPISGWGNGDESILKSIYLDDTPILSTNGSPNFKGVRVSYLIGTEDQSYLPEFDTTENTVSVGTEVKKGTPIVRTITDSQLDSVIVAIRTGQMVSVNNKGDQDEASVELSVELVKDDIMFDRKIFTIKGKTSDHFFKDVIFDELPDAPFQIRVIRVSNDSTTSKLQNKTYFASYVEIINAKLSYPHSSVVGVEFDSELFGSSIPTRNYLVKGLQLKVPSNYDPVARTYDGFWDGTFKVAYSNNPAWVMYDLLTSKRYGLGRKIAADQVDKWGLYSIAQYCDQLVDNGLGKMEPRFTCNAYLADSRQAYEVLQDLVSCFRGMYVWDGQNVSVNIDRTSDPVGTYTNSNVVDGIFSYSSSPLNTIATAVQIQYVDAADGYRTKTEYVSDDAAIKRYGLNVKRITSFGCTSRSQAIRTGKWLLETSRLERQSVTFSIGRAGLKHLPYDIIQVVDNDYAGVDMAGRIESVNQNIVILDRDVSDITGTEFSYLGTDGDMRRSNIVAQVSPNTLRLENVIVPHVASTFVIRSKGLGKRFFRAMSISEDKDAGTYTISAIEHVPEKEAIVDNGAVFEPPKNIIYDRLPTIDGAQVQQGSDGIVIDWSGSGVTEGVTYQVKVYRDNLLMNTYNDLVSPTLSLKNLRPGKYKLEIRARNKNGQWSEPEIREFEIDYTVYNFKAIPKLWAVELNWDLPSLANAGLKVEIWASVDINFDHATQIGAVASPTNSLVHSGLNLEDKYYYWARLSDASGNTGVPVGPLEGECSKDPSAIVDYIEGQITESALHNDLVDLWQSNIDTAVSIEAQARIDSIQQASKAAEDALLSTAAQMGTRIDSIQQASKASEDALLSTAAQMGTRIDNVENINADLAQQINTVTAANALTAAGLQTEINARIAGDQAEASARQTLATQVGNNTSAINASSQAVSNLKTSTATQFTNVNARIDNINPDMLVGIALEAGWVSDTNGTNQTHASHKRTKDHLPVYELVSYVARVTAVTADFNLRVVWYDQNKTFLAGTRTAKFTGAKSFTAPSGAMYVRVSWATVALKTISFTEVAASAASSVAADLADYKQAQAAGDAAQTSEINSAKSRLGIAESSITDIQTTYAKKTEVVAMAQTGLQATWQADSQAKVDALTIGSRNYLLDSKEGGRNKDISTEFDFTKLAVGTVLSISFDIEVLTMVSAGSRNRIGFEAGIRNSGGIFYIGVWLNSAASVSVGKQRVSAQFVITSKCTTNPKVLPYYNQTSGGNFVVSNVKLEIGSKPTDWLPAPEDTDRSIADVLANIDTFKVAQAAVDAAQTTEINSAKSRIGSVEGSISTVQSTYAKKTEVGALAQTALQATWKSDATALINPVSARVTAAEGKITNLQNTTADVQANIDAFKQAQASVDAAQTTEINSAKSRIGSVEGSISTVQSTYAKKTEVGALAQTALQATWKSDATALINPVSARVTAAEGKITTAEGKITTAEGKITTLQTTIANQDSAISSMNTTLSARIDAAADSGGDNLIDNGNFERGLTAWDNWGTLEVRRAEKRTSGVYQLILKSSDTSMFKGVSQSVYGILPSQTYTLSFMAARASADGAGMGVQILIHQRGDGNNDPQIGIHQLVGVAWQKCTFTFTTSNIAAKDSLVIFLGIRNGQAGTLIIRDAQLEMGSVATAFKPSINGQARKVQAMYSLKVEAFGSRKAMAGIAIGADGETGDAEVLILGNKFMIADPNTGTIKPMLSLANVGGVNQLALNGNFIANGTVLGRHIKANETITSPVISAGVINGTTINSTTINSSTVNGGILKGGSININDVFIVDSLGNLTAKSGVFDGTVTADAIDTAFAQTIMVGLGVYTPFISPSRFDRKMVFDPFTILLQRTNSAISSWHYKIDLRVYIKTLDGTETLAARFGLGSRGGVEIYESAADSWGEEYKRVFSQLSIDIPRTGCFVRITVTAGTRRTNGDGEYITDKSMFQLENDSYTTTIAHGRFTNSTPKDISASISRHVLQTKLFRNSDA